MAGELDKIDGRALRSERSREAIANAVYELVRGGNIQPTAEQVAELAEVGVRSVFRHFSDMDALYATISARVRESVVPTIRMAPPSGRSLRERAREMTEDRVALFERIAPFRRCGNLLSWRSPFLMEEHIELNRTLRNLLLDWLPELADAPNELVEALDQATSFEAWNRLRTDQRLGRARTEVVLQLTVGALVAELEK